MTIKKATPDTDAALNTQVKNSTQEKTLRLSSGEIAKKVQKRFIRYLLQLPEVERTPHEWIDVAGTDAVRQISVPYKNPLEYISDFRSLNGWDVILSIDVPEARNGRGKCPVYYQIPPQYRDALRKLIEGDG